MQTSSSSTTGLRGSILDSGWDYDVSYQRGETDRSNVSAGYTNVDAIEQSIRTVDGVTCLNNDPACVPINLFGGFGTITPAMVAANSALAIENENYQQTIATASVSGPINALQMPTADLPVAVALGAEYREEVGATTPDECWKLAPSSCLGGAGGNRLPVGASFDVSEVFFEGNVPLLAGQPFAESLSLELGLALVRLQPRGLQRYLESRHQLATRSIRRRCGRHAAGGDSRAERRRNRLADDHGSRRRAARPLLRCQRRQHRCRRSRHCASRQACRPRRSAPWRTSCPARSTASRAPTPNSLPGPETADTFTAGFVWTPEFAMVPDLVLSVDYYDIDITDVIGELSPQEILDGGYQLPDLPEVCSNRSTVSAEH
ncbi:MAG: hypothetical protein U5K76_07875 [Woeseiaceae bacterium]|nr:hypothetical protein [Woeseiaceae bacterium]